MSLQVMRNKKTQMNLNAEFIHPEDSTQVTVVFYARKKTVAEHIANASQDDSGLALSLSCSGPMHVFSGLLNESNQTLAIMGVDVKKLGSLIESPCLGDHSRVHVCHRITADPGK